MHAVSTIWLWPTVLVYNTMAVAKPVVTRRTCVVVASGATVPELGAIAYSPSGVISKSIGAARSDKGARSDAGGGAVPARTMAGDPLQRWLGHHPGFVCDQALSDVAHEEPLTIAEAIKLVSGRV